ncbi:MAG: hypothetical protein HY884_01920 [Deltaproteobacteria bacterium]|nr:hypothetical protein [Deltaproteobacteria bacterium]
MRKTKHCGFDYYLSKDMIKRYCEKPVETRLKWLYMGNLLRMGYAKKIVKIQDEFRQAGKSR